MDYADFINFFNEKLRERGWNLKRLSELSGIPLKHLENLSHGNFEALPSAPYVRGYLIKLSRLLDFNSDFWWKNFQEEGWLKTSGRQDRMTENRFAVKPFGKYFWPLLVILILVVYFGARLPKIFGRPDIVLPFPNQIVSGTNSFILKGRLTNADQLSINGENVTFDQNGYFQKTINLQPGVNPLEISAKKFLGEETKITRDIIYQTAPSSTLPF